jgi:hypothetical protein
MSNRINSPESHQDHRISRRALLRGAAVAVTGVGLNILQPHLAPSSPAVVAPKAEPPQAATPKIDNPRVDAVKARFITDLDEYAEEIVKLAQKPQAISGVAHAASDVYDELQVGSIILRNIARSIPLPQRGSDPHGIAGLGHFAQERGPHYPMGGDDNWEVVTDYSKPVDIIMGKKYRFGRKGEGFTPHIKYQVPGGTIQIKSQAEAGLAAKFAYERYNRNTGTTELINMLWAFQQWHKIEQTGRKVGDWINVREIDDYEFDPGDHLATLSSGNNMVYIAPKRGPFTFSFDQNTGFDQIQPANHTNFLACLEASTNRVWVGEAYIGPYPGPGKRRDLVPGAYYRTLFDNGRGIGPIPSNVTPFEPITLPY